MTAAKGRCLGAILLSQSILACAARHPMPAPAWTAELSTTIPAMLQRTGAPGLAVAVVDDWKLVFAEGFGLADGDAHTPVTRDTLFNVASVSKTVSTMGLLHLAEERALSLDAPLAPLVRSFHLQGEAASEVTMRRVLQHRAGLSMAPVPWFFDGVTVPSLQAVLRGAVPGVEGLNVVYPVGAEFHYSGGGFALLELMTEDIAGERFGAYMQRELFRPLGMTNTRFAPPPRDAANVATGYYDNGHPVARFTIVGTAAGGLTTTAADLARFVAAYARVSPGRRRFISEQMFAQITAETAPLQYPGVDPRVFGDARYGLGHGVHRTQNGVTLLYHSGGNPGFVAYFMVEPNTGYGLVMMANSANARTAMEDVRRRWAAHRGYDLPTFY
jgi:CubicO group peptidase (beta-lactamase class C family)